MKRSFITLSLIGIALAFMAFECSSAELTGAKLYINQKQYAKAKEALEKEVAKNPMSDEGWYLLGYLNGEEGNYDKMLDAFDHSLKASKKFEKQIMDSRKYYWAASFNKGVSYFNSAAKTASQDSMKMFFNKAAEMFRVSTLCEPDSIAGYSNMAMVYINLGEYQKAIDPLKKAAEIGKSADAIAMLGQLYLEQYQKAKDERKDDNANEFLQEALKVLEAGKAKFPDNGEILLRYSNALIAANKLDVAVNAFKEGVAKEPENKFYRYNYGVVLLNAGDYAGAEEQFKKAIEIDPKYANAIYNLGVTYVRWGTSFRDESEKKGETVDENKVKEKFNLALPQIKNYLEINPKEPALWELLGKIYANLGMKAESDEAFKKADEVR